MASIDTAKAHAERYSENNKSLYDVCANYVSKIANLGTQSDL